MSGSHRFAVSDETKGGRDDMKIKEIHFWNPATPRDQCFIRADDKTLDYLKWLVDFQKNAGRSEFEFVETETE